MSGLDTLSLVAGAVVTAVAALLQGTVGMGFALLSVPLLTLVDPRLAPVPQLLLSLPLSLSMAWRERAAMAPSRVAWILAGWGPGLLVGLGLLELGWPSAVLSALVGAMIVVLSAILAKPWRLPRHQLADLGVGVVAGASGLLASISGPPLALLFRGDSGAALRANLALVFSAGSVLIIFARVLSGWIQTRDIRLALLWFPALMVGLMGSRYLAPRVEGSALRLAIIAVSAFAGLAVVLRSTAALMNAH